MHKELRDIEDKVYTRDLYERDWGVLDIKKDLSIIIPHYNSLDLLKNY
jgi:hypothetical protein